MRGSKPAGSSGVSLVEIPCMQNREHTTGVWGFRDQSRCVSCVVHSRQITSHGFVTRMSHTHVTSHIAHNTVPYRPQDARQHDARPTRSLKPMLKPYRISPRSTTRYLCTQSTQDRREKSKSPRPRVKHSHRAAGGAAGSSSWRRRQEASDISQCIGGNHQFLVE